MSDKEPIYCQFCGDEISPIDRFAMRLFGLDARRTPGHMTCHKSYWRGYADGRDCANDTARPEGESR